MDPAEQTHVGVGKVLVAWFIAFAVGNLAAAFVVGITGKASGDSTDLPTWVLASSVVAMWASFLLLMPRLMTASRLTWPTVRSWFKMSNLSLGVPLGIGSQLLLVNAVNWPLSKLFPDVFSFDDVSQRAQGLSDAAHGGWKIVLFVVVVVGAPLVEEYVYRGSIQPEVARRFGATIGVVLTAVLFAAIHFEPIEFPGLLAFALVLGVARQRTGTLGLSVITHMAFNATGLVLVILV